MILPERKFLWLALTIVTALVSGLTLAYAQQEPQRGATSYMTVDPQEPFAATMARMRPHNRRSRSARPTCWRSAMTLPAARRRA